MGLSDGVLSPHNAAALLAHLQNIATDSFIGT